MATFTEEDRQLLDFLKKSFEKDARTIPSRQPWQELFLREETVEASKSVLASQVIEGLSGSWASMWSYGKGSSFVNYYQDFLDEDFPVSVRSKTSKLGQRGIPEIDFVPFQYGTNQEGSKGPSLVGHPISFEIIGPTLKSPATDWTWKVNLGAGPNGGDTLTMVDRPDGNPATCQTILEAYNLPDFTIGSAPEPNGGLYLVVTDDGENPGSIGAGFLPMNATSGRVDTARYEIFRISNITGSIIEIHPSKSFNSFFTLPPAVDRYVRAITLIHPYVTRLVPIPGSGAGPGREQTFVLVSPERAASSDLYPPYDGGTPLDGTWIQGNFTTRASPGTASAVGAPGAWLAKPKLPIPRPLTENQGYVESNFGVGSTGVGQWKIFVTSFDTNDIGKIIHIFDIKSTRHNFSDPNDFDSGSPNACLGWFEVLDAVFDGFFLQWVVLLLRLPEPDPTTGSIYYGPGPFVQSAFAPAYGLVSFTVHDPISSLWTGAFDMDRVDSARLKQIIDPKYVERSQKSYSDTTPFTTNKVALGFSSGRPDRAIFDTRKVPGAPIPEAYNPGNLMDLGFRMVLFPAGRSGGIVPDFDKPILGRELIIDPSIQEPQYVTIDYSAGSVTLSHPPPINIGGDIIPNGIFSDSVVNPRGEVILYAACVPFSMEDSQKGTGDRVTTRKAGDPRQIDSFSDPIEAYIDIVNTIFVAGPAPYVGPSTIAPNPIEIILDRIWEGPETGVFDIIGGGQIDQPSYGSWSYSETRIVTNPSSGQMVTALGNITCLSSVLFSPFFNWGLLYQHSDQKMIILRREVFFGASSENLAKSLVNYRADTTYGSSVRSSVIRFDSSTQKRNPDGTTSIQVNPRNQLWQPWGTWMPANISTALLSQLAADGIFAGPIYFKNDLVIATGIGNLLSNSEGQIYNIQVTPGAGNNYGIVTPDIRIQTQQRFRLVTKFQVNGQGVVGTDSIYYLGLIESLAANSIADALVSPINPAIFQVALRLEGDVEDPLDTWNVIYRNPITGFTFIDPVSILPRRSYYFILESEQDGMRDAVTGVIPSRLKVSITDQDLNVFYNKIIPWGKGELPNSNTNFNFFAGLEFVAGGVRRDLGLQMVSFVTRIDLPGPEFNP